MRILSGRGWLAAAVVALTLGRVQGAVVEFHPRQFEKSNDQGAAVFRPNDVEGDGKEIRCTVSQGKAVSRIRLCAYSEHHPDAAVTLTEWTINDNVPSQNPVPAPPTTSTTTTETESSEFLGVPRPTQRDLGSLNLRQGDDGGTAGGLQSSVNSIRITAGNIPDNYRDTPLYLKAIWVDNNNPGLEGHSFSRVFAVASSDTQFTKLVADITYKNPNPAFPESIPAISSTATADNALPTFNFGNPGNPNTNDSDRDGGSNPSSNESGGGGLAQGAVIAIAVVCGLLGLAAIFFLAFWLRRRQKRRNLNDPAVAASSGGPAGSAPTSELLAEKEAGAAGADITPHSPYSDDGNHLPATTTAAGPSGVPLVAPIAIPPGQQQQQQQQHDPLQQARSFTPYSDHHQRAPSIAGTEHTAVTGAPAPAGTGSTAPSPVPGRATPRGLTTPYLVEEGMTEEEIRRLEEEERALDAAIEQAQQQRRNT